MIEVEQFEGTSDGERVAHLRRLADENEFVMLGIPARKWMFSIVETYMKLAPDAYFRYDKEYLKRLAPRIELVVVNNIARKLTQ